MTRGWYYVIAAGVALALVAVFMREEQIFFSGMLVVVTTLMWHVNQQLKDVQIQVLATQHAFNEWTRQSSNEQLDPKLILVGAARLVGAEIMLNVTLLVANPSTRIATVTAVSFDNPDLTVGEATAAKWRSRWPLLSTATNTESQPLEVFPALVFGGGLTELQLQLKFASRAEGETARRIAKTDSHIRVFVQYRVGNRSLKTTPCNISIQGASGPPFQIVDNARPAP